MRTHPKSILILTIFTALMSLAACGSDSNSGGEGGSNGDCAGAVGCACAEADPCDDGLTCFNSICVPDDGSSNGSTSNGTSATSNGTTASNTSTSNGTIVEQSGLSISDASARSCEVMLRDSGEQASVVFGDAVGGRSMRRGERVAVAFYAKEDAPIATGAVALEADVEVIAETAITSVRCFDGEGQELDGVVAEFTD